MLGRAIDGASPLKSLWPLIFRDGERDGFTNMIQMEYRATEKKW